MKKMFLYGVIMSLSICVFSGCGKAEQVMGNSIYTPVPAQSKVKENLSTAKDSGKEPSTSITDAIPDISFERVENDFQDFCNTDNLEEMNFHDSLKEVIYTEIEETSSESYYQEVQFLYDLFSRTVKITINYVWNGNEWESGIIYDEEYTLNDNINGTWINYLEAGHPMQIDSTITVDIEKKDDLTCNYSFVRTSRIAGGNDETFNGTKEIDPVYDGIDGPLWSVTIAYDSASGDYIYIAPEGLVYRPGVSTEEYVLSKE